MSEQSPPPPTPEDPLSPDGPYRWDGRQRQAPTRHDRPLEPMASPDIWDGSAWTPPGFKGIGVAIIVLIVIGLAITSASHGTSGNDTTAGTNSTTTHRASATAAPSQQDQAVKWEKAIDPHMAALAHAETARNCSVGFTSACILSEQDIEAAAEDVQATLRATSAPDCMRPAAADLATAIDLTIQAINMRLDGIATNNPTEANAGAILASQAGDKVSAATDERDALYATACKMRRASP